MITPDYLKVEGEPSLVRDARSKAILSVNLNEKKKFYEEQKRELNIRKIETLEQEIADIKDLLKYIITKLEKPSL